MITLTFKKSRSKKYPEAVKLAKEFNHTEESGAYKVNFMVKDIFERWEHWNSLFLIVIEWEGTTIIYDGMEYRSKADMRRIYYSLQSAKQNWINYTTGKINQLYKVYTGEMTLTELEKRSMDNEMADRLIDYYTIKKQG